VCYIIAYRLYAVYVLFASHIAPSYSLTYFCLQPRTTVIALVDQPVLVMSE